MKYIPGSMVRHMPAFSKRAVLRDLSPASLLRSTPWEEGEREGEEKEEEEGEEGGGRGRGGRRKSREG